MKLSDYDVIDISPLISERLSVFPGDLPFERKLSLSFEAGNHLELSQFHGTMHLGAHADAPSHYFRGGKSIDQLPLEKFLGDCQVLDLSQVAAQELLPEHICAPILAPRLLLKTNSFEAESWSNSFKSLSPALLNFLSQKGVVLVGVDTPSVDSAESKDLPAHQAFAAHDILILETLLLKNVEEGLYQLIALPLKIASSEASPIRAVLLRQKESQHGR